MASTKSDEAKGIEYLELVMKTRSWSYFVERYRKGWRVCLNGLFEGHGLNLHDAAREAVQAAELEGMQALTRKPR